MELYGSLSHLAGRDAVYAATELIVGALFRLNAAEGDGTYAPHAAYRRFAIQWRGDGTPGSQTPYSHLHMALDGLWRMLAEVDGLSGSDADEVVAMAGDATHDMIGEVDPARRAYLYAVREVREEMALRVDDAEV